MKTTNSIKLSAYVITWVEFFPEKGIATKHDRKAFGDVPLLNSKDKTFRKHFPTKEKAVSFLRNFDKKLDKGYDCRIFSDKQFGMARAENNYAIPYTNKQWNEVYHIG